MECDALITPRIIHKADNSCFMGRMKKQPPQLAAGSIKTYRFMILFY
jgi:hypothetical protein